MMQYLTFQFIFSDINLYLWDESADGINSPITDMTMHECPESANRQKRSVSVIENIIPEEDIDIQFPLTGMEIIEVNSTTDDRYTMLYHQFNISETDPLPVQLTFEPLLNDMVLFANLGSRPTPMNYQWSFHGNDTQTLYIPSANLTGNNGSIWIGVGLESE